METIKIRNIKDLLQENKLNIYNECFLRKEIKPKFERDIKQEVVEKIDLSHPYSIPEKRDLWFYELLYNKYFSKRFQDSVYIIASILNLIEITNKHYRSRMNKTFGMKTEAAKLKEVCDAKRLYEKHLYVLELLFKEYFGDILSSFADLDFDYIFRLFFLGIVRVNRSLNKSEFTENSSFDDILLLSWKSLKNANFNDFRVFSTFKSTSFRRDCFEILCMLDDYRHIDLTITTRMPAFFVFLNNNCNYFEEVIDAINKNAEDLETLLSDAVLNVIFKYVAQNYQNAFVPILKQDMNCQTLILPEQILVSRVEPVQKHAASIGSNQ